MSKRLQTHPEASGASECIQVSLNVSENLEHLHQNMTKIHEHDGKRPQAFGIIIDGRLVCLYTYETDLSDGWENPEVHNDTEKKRAQALKMGANILMFAFMQ